MGQIESVATCKKWADDEKTELENDDDPAERKGEIKNEGQSRHYIRSDGHHTNVFPLLSGSSFLAFPRPLNLCVTLT